MPKSPSPEKDFNPITVLSVGPMTEDHSQLSDIFAGSRWPLCPGSEWKLEASSSVSEALPLLRRSPVPIVLCEGDSWREVLDHAAGLPDPPYVIVASRLADEYLWAEALNLGAYDVLAKPFDPGEVIRVLSAAWLHRQNRGTAAQAKSQTPRFAASTVN